MTTASKKKPTTLNVPSTSYIYSPNPITKRPPSSPTPSTSKAPFKTSPNYNAVSNDDIKTSSKPLLNINQGNDGENNYVVISGGGITKHPSPTVHITPKPITNLLTSSTINQLQTKRPPNDFVSTTERPPFFAVSTTPGAFISSSIYYPPGGNNDFHNEGYFAVVTHRPGVSSTAIYAVSPSLIQHGEEVPVISNDDFSNFPPVRNPNLNMTVSRPVMDESEIATPSFVEDAQLNSKIDLLVNKLIDSMQGNLDNLVDIVYERKNVSSVGNLQKKNETIAAKPQKGTTSKPPPRTSTAPPGRPSSQKETTKRPPAKTSTAATTKKTTTKKPTARPASTTTRRPPNRVTSTTGTTRKPTRRVTTTTTTQAPVEDEEQIVEEEEGGEGETVEEAVEEGEESNVIDESETVPEAPAFEVNGKIRKTILLFLIKLNGMRSFYNVAILHCMLRVRSETTVQKGKNRGRNCCCIR